MTDHQMNILVLGSGGREHAIVVALATSPHAGTIYVAPGNGGTASHAINIADLDVLSSDDVVTFAQAHGVELVVIGPEDPLVAGIADAVRSAGLLAYGPGASGARMEGSKTFSKEFMRRHGIPTAAYGSFSLKEEAFAYLEDHHAPIVVKADGLAAGKGVIIAMTDDEAREAVEACFGGEFGVAGATVVVEEMLTGPECSLLTFTDGTTMLPMAPAQDHKRALEGDTGPNTGGMGVYSPVPIVTETEHTRMVSIMQQTVDALYEEGIDYRGTLYGGFMLTPTGPKVLEFNARFGDPETQVILPRLETDLLEVMIATAQGRLDTITLSWSPLWAVSVVLASAGYPGHYEKGKPIHGIHEAEALEGVTVYHAGTLLRDDGTPVTSGGRVLDVTALGKDFSSARNNAYLAAALIGFDGKFQRNDIGTRAMRGRAAWRE
jgi:phosphoribosylamine--glycine ligase